MAEVPTLVGTDGQGKMSKSLGNTIYLSDDEATVRKKVGSMYTDPKRIRADIPGTVEGNPVFVYHDVFNPDKAEVEDLKARYREGKRRRRRGQGEAGRGHERFLDPMRERRARFEADSGLVDRLIVEGTEKTRGEVRADRPRHAQGHGPHRRLQPDPPQGGALHSEAAGRRRLTRQASAFKRRFKSLSRAQGRSRRPAKSCVDRGRGRRGPTTPVSLSQSDTVVQEVPLTCNPGRSSSARSASPRC